MKLSFALSLLCALVLKCSSLSSALEADDPKFGGRIVGGATVDISNRKFQVAVLPAGFICGGSLIKLNWVITAAHCTSGLGAPQVKVRAGSNYADSGGILRYVTTKIEHNQFNSTTKNFDISLLKLESPYVLSFTIGTIALSLLPPADGVDLIVSGYGSNSSESSLSTSLQQVTVSKINFNTCNAAYGGSLTSNMFCAGVPAGGKDSCQGDSGGPITYNGQLIGVVSFGQDCALPGFPGVYASIPSVYAWIQLTTLLTIL